MRVQALRGVVDPGLDRLVEGSPAGLGGQAGQTVGYAALAQCLGDGAGELGGLGQLALVERRGGGDDFQPGFATARSASAYCSRVDSVCSRTWPLVDCRTRTIAVGARCAGRIFIRAAFLP